MNNKTPIAHHCRLSGKKLKIKVFLCLKFIVIDLKNFENWSPKRRINILERIYMPDIQSFHMWFFTFLTKNWRILKQCWEILNTYHWTYAWLWPFSSWWYPFETPYCPFHVQIHPICWREKRIRNILLNFKY